MWTDGKGAYLRGNGLLLAHSGETGLGEQIYKGILKPYAHAHGLAFWCGCAGLEGMLCLALFVGQRGNTKSVPTLPAQDVNQVPVP